MGTYDGRQLMMEDDLGWKTTYDGRRLMMEDDITRNPLTRAPQLQLGIALVSIGITLYIKIETKITKCTGMNVWATILTDGQNGVYCLFRTAPLFDLCSYA